MTIKEWRERIPEFEKLWEESMKDYEYLKTLKYDPNNEFDTPEHAHNVKWWRKYVEFCEKYMAEHPEEFDEQGRFKI